MTNIYLRPNKTRANTAIILLGGMLFSSILVFFRQEYFLIQLELDFSSSRLAAIRVDDFLVIASLLQLLLYILTIIYFLRWFTRAYSNLKQFEVKLPYNKGLAGGAWFIPLFHWIAPIQIMWKMYRGAENILTENSLEERKKWRYVTLFLWWFLYVASGVAALIDVQTNNFSQQWNEHDPWLIDYSRFYSIGAIYLTMLAIAVVYNYSRLENKLIQIKGVEYGKRTSHDLIDDQL